MDLKKYFFKYFFKSETQCFLHMFYTSLKTKQKFNDSCHPNLDSI